jgi:hypothetical protein
VRSRTRTLLQLLLAAAIAGLAGCKGCSHPKPIFFNNKIASSNQDLSAAAKEFQKAVGPMAMGQPVDAGAVRQQYQSMQKKVKDLQDEFKGMNAPLNSGAGRDLLEKYKDFLDGQEKLLDGPIKELVQLAESGNPNAAKYQELMTKVEEGENKTRGPLLEAVKNYQKEQNFKPG